MTFEEVLKQALKKYEKQKGKEQVQEELEQYLQYAEAEKRRYGIKFEEGV
ncbi:hypothetical protein SAMN02746089_02568 [Caldanaerobius fijiensis DSM 17918]|uniref:Uncharacterized protein n=1 Tax=Caldanaerobius fijiensis DSM 17918 TaxID=1121256 RepID=A0A1M5EKW9_9THEO|nr:hypothetical protein [Caldanaerobius fijiensis]SHF79826.1 hypothetical protein SAMN02746089_02568 [Caldanaerobius fijiensis DSM 17918]